MKEYDFSKGVRGKYATKEVTPQHVEEHWGELSELEQRTYLETMEFSREFLESIWEDASWEIRCLTGRQGSMSFEFLRERWSRLDTTQKTSVYLFQEVPLEFTKEVWDSLGSTERIAALTVQGYEEEFLLEKWLELAEKERNIFIGHVKLSADFIAEHWPHLTERQKRTLEFRNLIKGVSKDHLPVLLVDDDPNIRQEANQRMEELINGEGGTE